MEEKITDNQNSGKSVSKSMFWSFLERIAAQAVSVIVGIILARILSPDEYGIIAIVMIFITLCDVFVSSGFGTALVQKKQVEELDYNTTFWFSFFVSVVLYVALFFTAPVIASFYQIKLLTPVIRVFGIRLIVTSLNTIQVAKVQREMAFKKYFLATIAGTVISCVVGVVMAYAGYGVWALVAQYLTNTLIASLLFAFVCGWVPKFQFSFRKVKEIWGFGSKVLGATLINTGVVEVQSFLVGKVFTAGGLAIFDQGKKYPSLLVNNVNSSISKVMLPFFSNNQEKLDVLKRHLRKTVKISNYILCPLLIGFCAVAPTFVNVVLTPKWSDCIPYVQIFAIMYLTRPHTMICHQALLAINRAGIAMIILTAINVVALGGTLVSVFVFQNMLLVAIFFLAADVLSLIGFAIAMKRYLSWSFREQFLDVFASIAMSLVMGVAVWFLPYVLPVSGAPLLLLQIALGAAIYVGLSAAFRVETFTMVFAKVKNLFKKPMPKVEEVEDDFANQSLPQVEVVRTEEKRRYHGIDFAKFFLAFFVVACHVHPYGAFQSTSFSLRKCLDTLLNVAVPFFFIANGFFLAKKLKKPILSRENAPIVWDSFKKFLRLYAIWTVIYLPITIYYYATSGMAFMDIAMDFVFGLFFKGEHWQSWHLWYLCALLWAHLILLLLIKMKSSDVVGAIVAVLLFALAYVWGNVLSSIDFAPIRYLSAIVGSTGRQLTAPLYLAVGILLAKKNAHVLLGVAFIVVGFTIRTLFVKTNGYYSEPSLLLFACGLFIVAKSINLKDRKGFSFLGTASATIYFVHLFVYVIVCLAFYGKIVDGWKIYLIVTAVSVALSVPIHFLRKNKVVGACLTGKKVKF